MLDNLNECLICAPENFSGVSNWMPVQCSNQLSYEATQKYADHFFISNHVAIYIFFIKVVIKTHTRVEKALMLFNNGLFFPNFFLELWWNPRSGVVFFGYLTFPKTFPPQRDVCDDHYCHCSFYSFLPGRRRFVWSQYRAVFK